jgi:sugar phosphate permease
VNAPAGGIGATATVTHPRGLRGVYFGYWLIGAAFIANFVSAGLSSYVFGAFFKPMTDELEWSRSAFTLARTVGQFFFAIAGLGIGVYVDRHGGRRLMRIGVAVLAAALFAQSYVHELWQWIVLNGLVLTAGAAMMGNLVVHITLAKWFVEKRGRAVGIAAMGVSFSGVLLTPLATALVDAVGWRDAWRVLAVVALVIIVPITFLMRRTPEDYGLHPDGKSATEVAAGGGRVAARDFASSLTRREALHSRAFYLIIFGFGLGQLSIGMMLVQTIPFMTDAGYSRATASLMITLASVPSMLTKPVWGYFIDRGEAQRLTRISFTLIAIGLLTVVAAKRADLPIALFAGFFVMGIGWGGNQPLQEVVWATFFGRRYLGAVRGAGLPFALVLNAGAPLASSIYFDRVGNYDGAFIVVALLTAIAIGLVAMAKRPFRAGDEEPVVDAASGGG